MAVLSNADSYRKIHLFIDTHREKLNWYFGLDWKKAPAYTTVRNIILNTSGPELERIFREYGGFLLKDEPDGASVLCDGKVLRGSFDNINDIKSVQILSAFAGECSIIPGHEEIEEKSNEIPAARKLIEKLGLSGRIFTSDAVHCQEKTLSTAVENGNDVIVQVKENQKTLLNDCISSFRRLRTRKNGVRPKLPLKLTASVRCSIRKIKSGKIPVRPPSMFQQPS
jgi:predicted transposase YbfD/YdcC